MSVLLPTFGRPMTATLMLSFSGPSPGSGSRPSSAASSREITPWSWARPGDRERLAHSELMEFRDRNVPIVALGLVDGEDHGLAAAAGEIGHEAILRGDSRAAVHEHDEAVGLGDGALGLRDHQALDVVRLLDQPSGVDDDAGHPAAPRVAILAIARQPGEVRDQGIAGARQCVEERRLPHIGPTDQCDYRKHPALRISIGAQCCSGLFGSAGGAAGFEGAGAV